MLAERAEHRKTLARAQIRRYRANNPEYVERQKERKREWAAKNKAKVRQHTREWFAANPDKVQKYKFKDRIRKLANPDEVTAKPEVCDSCGSAGTRHGKVGGGIHLDHCHTKNTFRGWLCAKCNFALGLLDDDPVKIQKLILYLSRRTVG